MQYDTNGTCPLHCECRRSWITCTGVIPVSIPEDAQEVIIKEIDPGELYTKRFCHVQWDNVTKLSLSTADGSEPVAFDIDNGVFLCLDFITVFKLQSRFLGRFTNGTFSGLSSVFSFDISGCRNIIWQDLYETLVTPSNLPKLTHLILSRAGLYDKLILNQEFINALEIRPLTYLDLSFTTFELDFANSDKLCDTLTYFKAVGVQSEGSGLFTNGSHVCNSLVTLDISESVFLRNEFKNYSCINSSKPFAFYAPFFKAVQIIYMNNIITSEEKCTMLNCSVYLFANMSVLELSFTDNLLPQFDVNFFNDGLENLDISNNKFQTINPLALKNLKSIEILDLSRNELFETKFFNETFSVLFRYSQKLKTLLLSSNKLSFLPKRMLSDTNSLENLHLFNNSLQQISFDISHLLNLTVMDMLNNKIKYLDTDSQNELETLHRRQKEEKRDLVQVLLQGNPFSCECQYLDFLQWFAKSTIFDYNRNTCFCQLEGNFFPMNETAVRIASEDCARQKRKQRIIILSSTIPPVGATSVFVLVLILWKRRKRRLQQERFQTGMQRLRENANRFPVFLSYSSDDADFVKRHILRQFQVCLALSICRNGDNRSLNMYN